MSEKYGFDINKLRKKNINIRAVLRNCVVPEIGKHILDELIKE